MGNCCKCLQKDDDEERLIGDDSDSDVSSFHDGHLDEDGEATQIDGERDENYQKILKGLHEKLIDNEHMNILTGEEVRDKMRQYNDGLTTKIMDVQIEEPESVSPRRPKSSIGSATYNSGGTMSHQGGGDVPGEGLTELQANIMEMTKSIRDKIKADGGTEKVHYIFK